MFFLERLKRLDEQIKVEFELVGQRVGWLLAANSFLLIALISSTRDINQHYWPISTYIFCAITFLGFSSSLTVFLSVNAALESIKTLKIIRERIEEQAALRCGLEKLGIRHDSKTHRHGNLPARTMPLVLLLMWVALLLYAIATMSCNPAC